MTVQISICSAAQLFSGCLLRGHSPASDAIVTSDGAAVAGELDIIDSHPRISPPALMGWLLGSGATTLGHYTIRRGEHGQPNQ
mgnify:CR=1 FL=1